MDDKEAFDVLHVMLDKYEFSEAEKEALTKALGLLSWTALAKNNMRAKRAKKEKNEELS